jgi:hypothetical protein
MSKIYVVFGQTGEYSDFNDWPVKAFRSESKAADLVVLATARANSLLVEYNDRRYNIPEGANEYDPYMQMDYTGTSYRYIEVDWED